MLSSHILEFLIFLDNLPKETHEKIIITAQVLFLIAELIYFVYLKFILFKNIN